MNYANYIITIKNSVKAQRRQTFLPYSKLNKEISKVLKELGFLEDFKEENIGNKKVINAKLKYDKRTPRFNDVELISKPSLKRYVSGKGIKNLERRGKKILIISTSQGVMTGKEAAKKGIGGEALFAIW